MRQSSRTAIRVKGGPLDHQINTGPHRDSAGASIKPRPLHRIAETSQLVSGSLLMLIIEYALYKRLP